MQDQIIISISPALKIIGSLAGLLIAMVAYYIREMQHDIKELNKNIIDSFQYFAPRDETCRKLDTLESIASNHERRLTAIEEWRNLIRK